MKLGAEAFQRAVEYVRLHARPADQALLAYHFESGAPAAVAAEVEKFQNADGGFGNAVEPDFRLPASSPMATTVGFQFLTAVGAPADSDVVRKGIGYLLATYDTTAQAWPFAPPEIADFPRAPWWEYAPPARYAPDAKTWGNPNCEIIAHLNTYADLVDATFLAERTAEALAWLDAVEAPDPHALICCVRFAESLTGGQRDRAFARICEFAPRVAKLDPAEWPKYAPQPLWYARRPDSPLVGVFGEALDANLDFLVAQQSDDGSWQPTWTWGRFEDAWQTARTEWAGHLTVTTLKLLADFGRTEEP